MGNNSTRSIRQVLSCIMMMLALAWLTVSIPFVYNQQQKFASEITSQTEESNNPFANTTEEKTESGNNTLSEYLHDVHVNLQYIEAPGKYSKCHPSNLYYAFHPELISPPPEA